MPRLPRGHHLDRQGLALPPETPISGMQAPLANLTALAMKDWLSPPADELPTLRSGFMGRSMIPGVIVESVAIEGLSA